MRQTTFGLKMGAMFLAFMGMVFFLLMPQKAWGAFFVDFGYSQGYDNFSYQSKGVTSGTSAILQKDFDSGALEIGAGYETEKFRFRVSYLGSSESDLNDDLEGLTASNSFFELFRSGTTVRRQRTIGLDASYLFLTFNNQRTLFGVGGFYNKAWYVWDNFVRGDELISYSTPTFGLKASAMHYIADGIALQFAVQRTLESSEHNFEFEGVQRTARLSSGTKILMGIQFGFEL